MCGAHSRQTGQPCRRYAIPGRARCKHHGGKSTGRPASTRLYARHLQPDELDAFDAAEIAGLDDEIRLAKAHLDWAVGQWAKDPGGGIAIKRFRVDSGGRKVVETSTRPWTDIVREHLEAVGRAVSRRAKLLESAPPADEDLERYEEWLKHARGGPQSSGS